MANRVLRDWTDSDKVNCLSVYAERFFTRLIMKVDDFGCYPANVRLLKSTLFPLLDDLKNEDVESWLNDCHVNGLLKMYVIKEKKYLQITDFKQRLRQARGKYPLPIDGQWADNGRPETKRNETEEETETNAVCDLKDLDSGLVRKAADLAEAICAYFEVKTVVTSKVYNAINDFTTNLANRNELEIAALALKNYMAYKARSQQAKHGVLKWIGTKEDHYRDGEWTMTDWELKNKNYNGQWSANKGTNGQISPEAGKDYTGGF